MGSAERARQLDSDPYPWPYDGLRPTELAIVVAGWDRHWSARATEAEVTAATVRELVDAVLAAGGRAVTLTHDRPASSSMDEVGAGAPPQPLPSAVEVRCAGVDGFYGSDLDLVLRTAGCTQLVLVGHGLEGPVHSTLRSANDRGYECLLVTDACSSLSPDLVQGAVSSVCMSGGIFGAVGLADALGGLLAFTTTPNPQPT